MFTYEVIIPTKNEYNNLKILLPSIKKKIRHPILIIDNSDDRYKNKISSLCKKNNVKFFKQKSSGKGKALVEAAQLSKADILIFFDADCSHSLLDLKKIINIFNNFKNIDHVGGSRMRGGSDELFNNLTHLVRLFGSMIITSLFNIKFNSNLTDTQNGLRGIKRKLFLNLNIVSAHTTIEMEMVGKTLLQGFNYVEIPTHEYSRIHGVSKIDLYKHSLSYVICLLSIIFSKKTGKKLFNIKLNDSINKNIYLNK
jgi:glycosyltransferase involved in cell wall biosynthesis